MDVYIKVQKGWVEKVKVFSTLLTCFFLPMTLDLDSSLFDYHLLVLIMYLPLRKLL